MMTQIQWAIMPCRRVVRARAKSQRRYEDIDATYLFEFSVETAPPVPPDPVTLLS